MAVEFKESRTRENLMRAFAGESQARNRYTIAAETAREQGLFAISQIFLFKYTESHDILRSVSSFFC